MSSDGAASPDNPSTGVDDPGHGQAAEIRPPRAAARSTRIEALERRCAAATAALIRERASSDLAKARHDERLRAASTRLAAAQGKWAGAEAVLRDRVRDLEKKLAAANAAEALLRGRAGGLQSKLAAAAATQATLRARVASVQNRLDVSTATLAKVRLDHSATVKTLNEASASVQHAVLPLSISRGMGLAEAAIAYTETLLGTRERRVARALAHSLASRPQTAEIGRICIALHALKDGLDDYAWSLFQQSSRPTLIEMVPVHFSGLWLWKEPAAAAADLARMLDDAFDTISAAQWWGIAKHAGGFKQYALQQRIVEAIVERDDALVRLTEADARALRWTRQRLVERAARAPVQRPGHGTVSIGLMDYKMLDRDRASSNVGDHVQTLAMVSNLLRFQDIDYDRSDLGIHLDSMKARIAPDRRISGTPTKVTPIIVDRDFSSGRTVPEPTWTIAFGWYMHPNFKRHFDFPFAANIRPIFLSFHINNRNLLSQDGVDYLKTYQPIGCRDWTTVYLLRERGVSAFFSGCVTSTIGQIFTNAPPPRAGASAMALVDYRPAPGEFDDRKPVTFTQVEADVRDVGMVEGLQAAEALLQRYRAYDEVATSRLHCYLPCTSIGLTVHFRPRRRSDVRFEGLLDLGEAAFAAMRHAIEDKLEQMFRIILSGAGEDEVYARWRELCAPDVQAADAYCNAYRPLPDTSFDVRDVTSRLRRSGLTFNGQAAGPGAMDVALALDRNLQDHLPVTLESLVAHASRPVRLTILSRDLGPDYFQELAADFPAVTVRVFLCDEVSYTDNIRVLAHTTVSTIDRLILPDLLTDVDRLIYLDIDTLVLADLAELHDLDLEGHPLAGKNTQYPPWKYGHNMVYSAAGVLDAEKGWDLRRRMHAAGRLDFPSFNAGVLLLDLDRMRRDDFARHAIPLVEGYAMNDQDALNVYARFDRVSLAKEWNAVPNQDPTDFAKILHFAGSVKPWDPLYILRQEDFQAYRDKWLARRQARSTRKQAGEATDSPES